MDNMEIINKNNLLSEIRRIIKKELDKQLPKSHVNKLWEYLNLQNERIKCLEEEVKENKYLKEQCRIMEKQLLKKPIRKSRQIFHKNVKTKGRQIFRK